MKRYQFRKTTFGGSLLAEAISKKTILTLVCTCLTFCLKAGTIHWITFINTTDAIGEINCNARTYLYSNFVNVINNEVQEYGYDCKIYDFYGKNFTTENCKNCINNLKCDSTDVIVFYYIGYGGRISTDYENSKYPLMIYENNIGKIGKAIPMSWLHQSLKNKNAKLTITIAVCSNILYNYEDGTEINEIMLPSVQICKYFPENLLQSKSPIANAFIGFKGDMIICSASPLQDSWSVPTPHGGMDVFTSLFVSTFENKKQERNFWWTEFLNEVAENTKEATKEMPMKRVQTPVFDYNLISTAIPNLK